MKTDDINRLIDNMIKIFRSSDDPVKHCEVYKAEGCAHVDGFLCDMDNCSIRSNFQETFRENFKNQQEPPRKISERNRASKSHFEDDKNP